MGVSGSSESGSRGISRAVSDGAKVGGACGVGDWVGMGHLGDKGSGSDDGGGNDSLGHSWGRSVDDSVKSVDGVSGVGDGSDGTIGLNKGVLSLDNISVSALGGGLGVSGKSIGHGVSVVVLWVGIIRFRLDGDGLDYGGVGYGKGCSISDWTNNSSGRSSDESEKSNDLDHLDVCEGRRTWSYLLDDK